MLPTIILQQYLETKTLDGRMSQIRQENKIGQCPLRLKNFCQEAKNWKDVLGKEKTLIIEESIGQWTVSLTNKTKIFIWKQNKKK